MSTRDRRAVFAAGCFLSILSLLFIPMMAKAGTGPIVAIDLDRNAEGVQDEILDFAGGSSIQGSVVVLGGALDTVSNYTIELTFTGTGGGAVINCNNHSFMEGEVTSTLGSTLCGDNILRKARLFVSPEVALGDDGTLVVFSFDAEILCDDGDGITVDFSSSAANPQLGISVNGVARTFGEGSSNQIATMSASIRCGGGGGETPTPCPDSGYYLLDGFGGRHHVGSPLPVMGSLYFGRDVAEDLEWILSAFPGGAKGTSQEDLAVLDTFGAIQYVFNPSDNPNQSFYWPEGSDPACGYAVDLEVTGDFNGFWVLTENGGIFRAGTALPDGGEAQLGNDAAGLCDMLGIPFGGGTPRDPNLPAGDGATISAVGFVVVRGGLSDNPTGFVILDSQGGHYIYDGEGNSLSDGVDGSILNADTPYPYFKGLDIARDIELPARAFVDKIQTSDSTAGLVILDGWGGVHPVPVGVTPNSQVSFLRNDGLTSVGHSENPWWSR